MHHAVLALLEVDGVLGFRGVGERLQVSTISGDTTETIPAWILRTILGISVNC